MSRLDARREAALRWHGLLRRYDNLVQQSAACVRAGDDDLHTLYYRQKRFLETCDGVVSVGANEVALAAVGTWFGERRPVGEWLTQSAQSATAHESERRAVLVAMHTWGAKKLAGTKIAIITTDEEIGKWLKQLGKYRVPHQAAADGGAKAAGGDKDERYELNSQHDAAEQREADAAERELEEVLRKDDRLRQIAELWKEHHVDIMPFVTPEHPTIQLACNSHSDAEAADRLMAMATANLAGCQMKRAVAKDGAAADGEAERSTGSSGGGGRRERDNDGNRSRDGGGNRSHAPPPSRDKKRDRDRDRDRDREYAY